MRRGWLLMMQVAARLLLLMCNRCCRMVRE